MQSLPMVFLFLLFVLGSSVPHPNSTSTKYLDSSLVHVLVGKKDLGPTFSKNSSGRENGWTKQIIDPVKPIGALSEKDNQKQLVRQEQPDCKGLPGLSGSRCSSTDECQGERTCQENVLDATRCAFRDASILRCGPGMPCQEEGEFCLRNDGLGLVGCLSEDFAREKGLRPCKTVPETVSPSPVSGSDPCIAVDSFKHLSREDLVFDKHRLSNVLCDKNHSCATAGHMVTYRGNSMMMKSYCETVGGCTKRVMLVNSPRYRMRLEIPSKSDGLVFTALSARYVTLAEEHVLSIAIHMGL